MTTPTFDPTLKTMVEADPESWPELLGGPVGPTQVIDADIATVTGAADKVLRVESKPPYLLHLEFVVGHDSAVLPQKVHLRNALLENRHDLPVRSGVILLKPDADSPQLTGQYQRGLPEEQPYLQFGYHVVRVWQLPPKPFLSGRIGLLPLAPISDVTESEIPGIIRTMDERLRRGRNRRHADILRGSAYILLGLRWSAALAARVFEGVVSMKESTTYQAILAEGRDEGRAEGSIDEARRVLRLQGDDAFGPPDAQTDERIQLLDDLPQLEALLRRLLSASSWQELLGPPRSRGRRRPSKQ